MKLSIIVPVYNMAGEGKLDYCLNSLVNQTISDYEIIAVDDCSTDNSFEVLQRFQAQYPDKFIAVHSPVNHHQGGAKNIGLAMAKGDWLGFIDADDWIVPDYYERLLKKAEETGADMVGCDYCLTDEHSFKVGKIVHNNNDSQTGVMNKERYKNLLLETGSLVVKVYKRNLIVGDYEPGTRDKLDVFPEDIFYEDNAVSNTWMLRSRHFEYIREPLYFYYQHQASTVHSISRKNLEDRMTAGRQIIREAKANGYFEEYRDEIEFQYTVLFYVNTLFSAMPKKSKVKGCYAFTKALAGEMKKTFPDFQSNSYYIDKIHPEEKKLIAYQMKSQLFFYAYYRLLWFYRDLRSGK
ncbi:MAG: glycosyltransferase [Butyrivibrio sp.]|uniref:glycosyltransferase family 2 protein n=1 Tax=Butyrivibrio sp. TaxID=28121 RepID=UPI001B1D4849|nr:glycosyltransferase [Butyrivibrio sp.]MBO6241610.1 glycosyltransferase [Butyrivibrio sp.]